MTNEAAAWVSLAFSGLALIVSGVSYAHHLYCWADIESTIDRANRPLEERARDHDLQLELLTAIESRRAGRPTLTIARTGEGPDVAA